MLESIVRNAIKDVAGIEDVPFNVPPDRKFGDFSSAVCLAMAKKFQAPPMDLAKKIAGMLKERHLPHIREISVTSPGFLNFRIDWPSYASEILPRIFEEMGSYGRQDGLKAEKIFIEHTSVNPNKAMHIGHLRNSVIGDTLSRVLRGLGKEVEVCNYIDDTGNQVIETVTALLYLDEPVFDEGMLAASPASAARKILEIIVKKVPRGVPFDDYCWDLYARFHHELDANETLRAKRELVMKYTHIPGHPFSLLTRQVAGKMVESHLRTVARLNIFYQLLNWESDILARGFWEETFGMLKEKGAIKLEEEGPNSGCWVIPLGGVVETDEGSVVLDKILVRSDGTVVYTGKDLSYQLWKFGLLKTDFLYREWGKKKEGGALWTTDPEGDHPGSHHLTFGHADRVINVIDARQSYTQDVLVECLQQLGFEEEAENSVHLAYEVVNLSHGAAQRMGVEHVESGKSYAMSGRAGLGVRANDFIDRVTEEVKVRTNREETSALLAAAAIRYYLLRVGFEKQITFDFDDALRTTGDTGVYLEYAHARACGILRKSENLGIRAGAGNFTIPEKLTITEMNLIKELGLFPSELQKVAGKLALAHLATYGFNLATAFTDFYEHPDPDREKQVPFIHLKDRNLQIFRLTLVSAFRQVMANLLCVLGMPPLEKI